MNNLLAVLILIQVYVVFARRVYIVQLNDDNYVAANQIKFQRKILYQSKISRENELIKQHDSILNTLIHKDSTADTPETPALKLYSYTKLINGFSALMSEKQAKKIKAHPLVSTVRAGKKYHRDALGFYKFLGLNTPNVGAWTETNGSDTVIGIIDDGIWPENPSFRDSKYSPIPAKWKGICQVGQNFTAKNCNRKLVGARYFNKGFLATMGLTTFPKGFPDYNSPRGMWGHGSHTSSIAGGALVMDASISGVKFGLIQGVSFGSRIAMYKACWGDLENGFCAESDIVAGMEFAMKDGVDVISVSISGSSGKYSEDVVAQAALFAVRSGVPCVFSGGNSGDAGFGTVRNTAPWVLTVAASTTDQTFENKVTLGSGASFKGFGFSKGLLKKSKNYTFISAQSASTSDPPLFNSSSCVPGSLNPEKVKGKIVFCETDSTYAILDQSKTIKDAGGLGMITYMGENNVGSKIFTYLPTTVVSYEDAKIIRKYVDYVQNIRINNTISRRTAMIYETKTIFGNKEAPVMAVFSSKGPNFASNYILKPDITAPGVNILAAYSQSTTELNLPNGEKPPFAFLSGTSMACPHVSGAVALIKSLNPSWSPSWIYSAIITTGSMMTNKGGYIRDGDGYPASPFNMGGGHINVTAALNPGLVFGITNEGYKDFQCTPSGGYLGKCKGKKYREIDLNLPSLSLYNLKNTTTVVRKLTLVGEPSLYSVKVNHPAGSRVIVEPKFLNFRKNGETKAFTITVKPLKSIYDVGVDYQLSDFTFGLITWKNSMHSVKMNVGVSIMEV